MNLIKQTFSVKKMIVLLAALLLVMALAACGTKKNNDTKPANEVTPTGTDAKPETPAATATETPAPTATDTPAPTATETPTPAPTATEVPEPTPTPAEPGTPEYYLQAYAAEHASEIAAHKDQYLAELRAKFAGVPNEKFALLATCPVDEHKTVELYEFAVFGYASACTQSETDPKYEGIDKTKELYDYRIIARLLEDGKYVSDTGAKYAGDFGYGSTQIYGIASWNGEGELFREAVCKMVGLPFKKTDAAARSVTSETWVHNSLAFQYSAIYFGDSAVPVISTRQFVIMGNDGGTFDDEFFLGDGTEIKFDSLKKVKEGTGFLSEEVAEWPLNGRKVTWTLLEVNSDVKVIKIYTDDFEGPSVSTSYYLCVGDCLVCIYSDFVL